MPNPMKQFNVMLSADDRDKLDELCDLQGLNAATLFRHLLARAYSHIALRQFQCPSGQNCYCPHMHPLPSPPQPPKQGP